jgi:hypothetical protein
VLPGDALAHLAGERFAGVDLNLPGSSGRGVCGGRRDRTRIRRPAR